MPLWENNVSDQERKKISINLFFLFPFFMQIVLKKTKKLSIFLSHFFHSTSFFWEPKIGESKTTKKKRPFLIKYIFLKTHEKHGLRKKQQNLHLESDL